MKRTFKKAISVFLVVAMLLCAAPLGGFVGLDFPSLFDFKAEAASYSGKCGDNLTWSLDTETGVLNITGTGAMTDWNSYSTQPWHSYRSSIKTVNIASGVTSIGYYAFSICDSLASITIPDSVTRIGLVAFAGCDSLTSVTIPDSVTSIDFAAFDDCTSLTDVYYGSTEEDWNKITIGPDNDPLTSATIHFTEPTIASGACDDNLTWILFESCLLEITGTGAMTDWNSSGNAPWYSYRDSIKTVNIVSGVTSIGSSAFGGCTSLASVTIPDSVISIGDSAFGNCESLTSITIPGSVTSIGDSAFYDTALTSITIPDSVITIGDEAFDNCENLTSVSIGDGVSAIGYETFNNCINLTNVTIGSSVTLIGDYSFSNCYNLASITIGNSVTTIGEMAFAGCIGIKSVTFSDSITTIGENAFFLCNSLTDVYYGGTEEDWSKITIGSNNEPLTSATIHFTVPTIASGVCGEDLTWTLYESGLLEITGTGAMTNWTASAKTPWYSYRDSIKSVNIAKGVTTIGYYSFQYCTNIESVTISDGVHSIGGYAFYGCSNLKSVTIPDSLTSIDAYVFRDCKSLKSITIPKNVTIIRADVFYNCTSLESITVDPANADYSSDERGVLFNKDKTELIQYPAGRTETSYIIPDGVTSIERPAFYGCKSLISVTIPDTVTEIGNYSFYACSNLTDVYYGGTQAQWDKIRIDSYNGSLTSATIYYNHPVGHVSGEWETVTEPSCTDEGQRVKKCTICQKILETESIPKLTEHNYKEEITTPATCTTAGVKTFTCVCGDSYTETIKATGHSLKQIKVEATCIENGKSCYQCQNCFVEYGVTVIPAKGHTVGEWETTVEPGCETEGTKIKECMVCGEILETELIPSKGHSHEEKIITAPTCSAEGLAEYTCACGDSYSVKLPFADHDLERYFTAPSSTEPGFDYYICNSCGNMIGDMVFLPATGFEPINGMIVDYANNIVYGLDAGVNSLDIYTNIVADGYEWTYTPGQFGGFGTGTKATLKNGDEIIGEYTIVIFGDVQGDGWYDGEDAFMVNLIAKGMLSKDDVGEAIWTAADCNHDGEINEADVDLLTGAGLMLNDVDQSKTVAELATNSDYIEYVMLIDQSAGMTPGITPDVDDSQEGTTDSNTAPEQPADEINIEAIITTIFDFIKKLFTLVFSFIIK